VGALIVFDVANRKSFEHVNEWLSALLDKAESNVQVGLVGHKVDQLRREVTREEAQEFATKFNLFYVETTVKDPYSIRSAFKRLLNSTPPLIRRDHHQKEGSDRYQAEFEVVAAGE
jgi:GTPase SAR1 family protein